MPRLLYTTNNMVVVVALAPLTAKVGGSNGPGGGTTLKVMYYDTQVQLMGQDAMCP